MLTKNKQKNPNRDGFMKATPYLCKKWSVLTKLVWTPHAKNAGNQLVAKRHTHVHRALTIPTKPSFLRELERLPVSRTDDEVDFKIKWAKKKGGEKKEPQFFLHYFDTMTQNPKQTAACACPNKKTILLSWQGNTHPVAADWHDIIIQLSMGKCGKTWRRDYLQD